MNRFEDETKKVRVKGEEVTRRGAREVLGIRRLKWRKRVVNKINRKESQGGRKNKIK